MTRIFVFTFLFVFKILVLHFIALCNETYWTDWNSSEKTAAILNFSEWVHIFN